MASFGSRLVAGRGGWAFAAYLVLACCFLGLPVAAHPERDVIGGLFTDPQIFVWSFAWWPHAILHGLNPIYTHQIWAPDGFNLAWATSVPGLAIAFAPLTLLFGPVLAYNVASILMPVLAAWTAFLLCRRVTGGAGWPSLAGGYLFGFSTYILAAELTHIFSAAVFLLPVAALLVLRFLDGDLAPRGLALRFGLLLAAQMLLSTEVLFVLTLALAVGLVLALMLAPATRAAIRRILVPLGGAYLLAAVLTAPFLYYVATGLEFRAPTGAHVFVADLLNVVVPTMASLGGWWSKAIAAHFPANDAERGTYLGLPLLVIVALYAWDRRRSPGGRWLVVAFLVAVVGALGSWLTVNGHEVSVLYPGAWLAAKPFFEQAMPVRLMVFAALGGAVMTALWAASSRRPRWLRIVLPALAALAIAPNVVVGCLVADAGGAEALHDEHVQELHRARRERAAAPVRHARRLDDVAGANELLVPRTRAATSRPYPPPSYTWLDGMRRIATEQSPPDVTTGSVLQLVRLKRVTTIVLDQDAETLWGPVLAPLGTPQDAGGTLIYRLRGAAPLDHECGIANERT